MELCPGRDDKRNEGLWVRIRGQINVGNTVMNVY